MPTLYTAVTVDDLRRLLVGNLGVGFVSGLQIARKIAGRPARVV